MASFTAGTTFTDGVANDVTAAKLNALVTNATPTSGFIQDRTSETVIASNDTVLIGDASDSNNLKRMTVDNLMKADMNGNINSTSGTIQTLTSSTATITGGTFSGSVNSTTGTIATFNSTTGTIPTLVATTLITTGAGTVTAPAISPTGDSNNGLFFPAADNIAVSTNGTERVRVDSSGNVGIGTTGPSTKLDVLCSPNAGIRVTDGTQVGIMYASGVGGIVAGTTSTHPYILYSNNTERLRIDSSGNVGIGTASPATPLNISTSASSVVSETVRLENSSNTSSNGNKITWRNAGQTTEAAFISGFREGAATSFGVAIGTSPNFTSGGTNAVERLRIDSSGNVGIGTTSPQAKLDVQGGRTFLSANNEQYGLGVRYINTGGPVYFGALSNSATPDAVISNAGGSAIATFTNAGNVGIGTTGPVNKLEIVGSFGRGAPVTKTGDFTLADTENWLIVNKGSSCTVTLPAASSWTGREFTIKVITAHAVVSASSNIVPRSSATAGTAILAATAGSWATLVSNGTNWVIMCGS